MPFFSGRRQPTPPPREPTPPPVEEPRHRSLFGHRDRDSEYTQQSLPQQQQQQYPVEQPVETEPDRRKGHGLFGRHRDPSPDSTHRTLPQQQQQQQYPIEQPVEPENGRRKGHGLFSRHRDPSPEYTQQPPPPTQQQHYPVGEQALSEPQGRKHGHGLFGRRHRSPSPTARSGLNGGSDRRSMTSHSSASSGSFHTTPDRADTLRSGHSGGAKRGFLSKRPRGSQRQDEEEDLDPSIIHARDRLMGAEAAEQDAARALVAARESAASARDDILRLEAEAREDARRAKIKEAQAREFSKRGKALGRFG